MKTLISICLVLLVGTFCVLGVYFAIVDHRESARREAEEKKKRQDAIDALETKVSKAKASFLAKYDDFDEDDPKETKKALSEEGVALSELYKELSSFYSTRTTTHHNHLEESYQTLLKALSVLPSKAKVRVLALERGRELAACGRGLQNSDGRITIYDEAAIQNDLQAYGGAPEQ